jgi:cystathionine beta-lyase/cystathionine gamma-synthase
MRIDPDDIAICIDDNAAAIGGSMPMAAPIVQTSLFAFPELQALLDAFPAEDANYIYTRGQNPTVELLERKLARLERGEACKCFASGMAAVSAVMMATLQAGDHILFVNQTYGPTLQLAAELARFGIAHDIVLDTDVDSVGAALRAETKLVWLESPGTMLCRTLDIAGVAGLARERGAVTCLDNSWATPLLQKPLVYGVDIVIHSCTKYIGGHSDVVGGAVVTSAARMREIFRRAFMLHGGILAPFDAWLLLRGLRTLPVRMRQHHEDGVRIAEFLRAHPRVRQVFHPAFEAVPSATLSGYSGLFSFELDTHDFDMVRRFVDSVRRFRIGVSWGGVESLIITPARPQLRTQGLPPGLVRISTGLEGADVLIEDLRSALDVLT